MPRLKRSQLGFFMDLASTNYQEILGLISSSFAKVMLTATW